jgi:hypothetical protein
MSHVLKGIDFLRHHFYYPGSIILENKNWLS